MFLRTATVLLGGLLMFSGGANAALIEDFEGEFPAWESGWLGTNSDLENYYGIGWDRGNNPDGLWISSATINFNPVFGASITSIFLDIAGFTPTGFQIFDMSNNLILDISSIVLTNGALSDPGTYVNHGVTSVNGVSRLVFTGSGIVGATSIDNVVVEQGPSAVVPEPSTIVLLGAGLAAAFLRRRRAGHSLN